MPRSTSDALLAGYGRSTRGNKARMTENRPALAGNKGHSRRGGAAGAVGSCFRPSPAATIPPVCPASLAVLGSVVKSALMKKALLIRGEYKLQMAIAAH